MLYISISCTANGETQEGQDRVCELIVKSGAKPMPLSKR